MELRYNTSTPPIRLHGVYWDNLALPERLGNHQTTKCGYVPKFEKSENRTLSLKLVN
jgi:hypothetical protein